MTLTRRALETILVKRCDALLRVVEMNIAPTGTNDDLNDCIGYALRKSGYSVADVSLVEDTDAASVTDADIDMVLDFAELRLLGTINTALVQFVDIAAGPLKENLSQHAAALEKTIARLQAKIDNEYGSGSGIETGLINFGFAEHSEFPE